jgi:hypothetical protein
MSKKTPGSKYAMKAGKARYKAERERYREKLARRRAHEDISER